MKNMFHAIKTIGCLTAVCMLSHTAFAAHHTVLTPVDSNYNDAGQPTAYVALSGGYGSFMDMANGSGQGGFTRIGFGAQWLFENTGLSLLGEAGVQTGNRMQLTGKSLSALYGGIDFPPNIYLTINAPVDILAGVRFHFDYPVFLQVKAGGVYMRSMIDTGAIEPINQWDAELQVGAGWDITRCHHLVLSYQRFFGKDPSLKNVGVNTATLNNLPTWQAGMLSLEVDL